MGNMDVQCAVYRAVAVRLCVCASRDVQLWCGAGSLPRRMSLHYSVYKYVALHYLNTNLITLIGTVQSR